MCIFLFYHCDIVAIQQNSIEFCNSSAFRCSFTFCDIIEKHVYKIIEAQKRPDNFLVILHDDVNSRSNTLVHQFYNNQKNNNNPAKTTVNFFTHLKNKIYPHQVVARSKDLCSQNSSSYLFFLFTILVCRMTKL